MRAPGLAPELPAKPTVARGMSSAAEMAIAAEEPGVTATAEAVAPPSLLQAAPGPAPAA